MRLSLTTCSLLLLAPAIRDAGANPHAPTPAGRGGAAAVEQPGETPSFARVPVAFVPNVGQWEHPARFVARLPGTSAFLEPDGIWLRLGSAAARAGAAVHLSFAGAERAELTGERPLAGRQSYFLGADARRWRTDVARYGAVRYRDPYPGVDLLWYARDAHLEYDVALAPGADIRRIEVVVSGARGLLLDAAGDLVVQTAAGPLRQTRPFTYEVDAAGRRRELAAHYELRGPDRFGFAVPGWSGQRALVVDPGILWSTFVGAPGDDFVTAVAVDGAGIVTIAGYTDSPSYPTTAGAFATSPSGFWDVAVTRLDPTMPEGRQLLSSTLVGGPLSDRAFALAVDPTGLVTIAGAAGPGYPTTAGAYDTTFNGAIDVFVTQLDLAQTGAAQIRYSTFVGGETEDRALAVAVDAAGAVTITGTTTSGNFPVTANAFDTSFNGGTADAFVARLDPQAPTAQQLRWSTFVGGIGDDSGAALALGGEGVVTIAGLTGSADFPTTAGAFDTTFEGGASDAFVTRLDPSQPPALQLSASTFVGGNSRDEALALAVDAAGAVTIAGTTGSPNFPTSAAAFDASYNGGRDAFVTRLDLAAAPGQHLLYSTFLGGASGEGAEALAVDAAGIVTCAGSTSSADFPTTPGAFDTTLDGAASDAFVSRLDPARAPGAQLVYSTYVGGAGADGARALALSANGDVTIAATATLGYPSTVGAFDPTYNGGVDAAVTRLDLLPAGVARFGRASPGCAGQPSIAAIGAPTLGNARFALTGGGAPAGAAGAVAIGAGGLGAPLALLGVELWVDPAGAFFLLLPVASTPRGTADLPLPIPPNPALAGQSLAGQLLWIEPTSPPPCPALGLSASEGLAATIQP